MKTQLITADPNVLVLTLPYLLLYFHFHLPFLIREGSRSLPSHPFLPFFTSLFIPFLAFGVTCLTTETSHHLCPPLPPSFSLPPGVNINKSRGARALQCSVSDQRRAFPSSSTFPFLHSHSLYALSPIGLQSPVSDQSWASVTCSCVYCQHSPVLGQLGEQEKARQ